MMALYPATYGSFSLRALYHSSVTGPLVVPDPEAELVPLGTTALGLPDVDADPPLETADALGVATDAPGVATDAPGVATDAPGVAIGLAAPLGLHAPSSETITA